MRLTANKIAGTLREHGYKLTPQRHAILKIIAASNDHLTPEAIHQTASLNNPTLGLVTVYRTLELLDELNLVCRLHAPDGCRGYMMRRPTEHHHHLICSQCGRVVDFTDCTLSNLEQRLSKETRYDINGHLLEFYGLCPECRPASG
jgi:Fur family ferric uptake transcriptional regulator